MNLLTRLFVLLLFVSVFTNFSSQEKRKPQQEITSAASYKAGNFINVNTSTYPESAYSVTDLIKKVLISGGSDCAEPAVTNVKVSPNTVVTNQNRSWGYFERGTTSFPFKDGIILSTGYARKAGNSIVSGTLSDALGTGTDTDLENAISPAQPLYDATYIEFDFVPFNNQVTFNYLFASEEYYSFYPCGGYSDGFALLLKKQGDANYTNLAVLPNNTPVSVTNIVPSNYDCGPINAEYFGGHNSTNIETNFNGRVVPLKAMANVIPGQTYHFKMVLADAGDEQFDSAVFLEAGSFNIGVQFQNQNGESLSSTIKMCANTPQTLVATTSIASPVIKWYKDNILISSVTGDTYVATTPGIYKVEVYIGTTASCAIGSKEINIQEGVIPLAKNANLIGCNDSGSAVFNLRSAQPQIFSDPVATFKYYDNKADAELGNANVIPTTNDYNSYPSSNKTIYVRVGNGECFKVVELHLNIFPIPAKPTVSAPKTILCDGGNIVLTSSSNTGNVWSTGETTKSITVTQAGIYSVKVNNGNCDSPSSSITITNQPDINLAITGDLLLCENETTVITSSSPTGNLWSNGQITQSITVKKSGSYTLTVTTASGCKFIKSVTVTDVLPIILKIEKPQVITCTLPQIILDAAASNFQTGDTVLWTASSGGNIVYGADTLNPTVDAAGTYSLTLKRGKCSKTISVQVIENKVKPLITLTSDRLTICQGESVTLTAKGGVSYIWSQFSGIASTQTVSPQSTSTYSVSGVGTNGCVSLPVSITITVVPKIVSDLEGGVICTNDKITLDAGTGPNYTYVWSNGEKTQTITVDKTGEYSVIIDNGVCSATFKAQVKSAGVPVINQVIYENNSLTINASNTGNGTLEYSFDGGVSWQDSKILANAIKNHSYKIAVRVKTTSCLAEGEYFTFNLSNVITPNFDGYNDVIDFSGISSYPNFSARIFDRYSTEVFKADKTLKAWDGTANYRRLSSGTYWYMVIWDDPFTKITQQRKGWIYLKTH